jgi:hypothetical protein
MGFGFKNRAFFACALIALSAVQLSFGTGISKGAEPLPAAPAAVKPGAPTGVKAVGGNGKVLLVWKAVSGATGYHVKRATKSGGPFAAVAAGTCLCATNTGLTNGTTYYFVVTAVNAAGESANSIQVSAKPIASASAAKPAAPTGLKPLAGNGQAIFVWKAVSGATGYHLKRATKSGGPYAAVLAGTCLCATNTGLTNGTTYFYVVSAVNAVGEGANSAQVSVTPEGPASTGVSSVTLSPGSAASITTGTLPFTATVAGTTTNKSVTWRAALGKISSTGYYTAPAKAATDTVTAVSNADPTKSDSASVKVTTAAPNPPPTSDTPPPTSTGSGLPTAFFSQSLREDTEAHFPTVPFGGLRLCGTNTTWAQIEISHGNYDWRELDEWTEFASSHGKDSMYTFSRVPTWAGAGPAHPPSDIASGDTHWKEFVTALVKHSLASSEHHIAYYEMWNEPDLASNWVGTPAQMVTMVKDAYAIIHALDPNAKVVGPSPATANQYGVHFLPAYYAAGGATAQDIVGLHAYLYNGPTFTTTPNLITQSISQMQALMAKYGISSKPFWLTEGNWNGSGIATLNETQQAAYLAQEYMLIWSTNAVARYYWYSWDNLKIGFLWDDSKGIRPAGTAYGLLAKWLIGSTHGANQCSEASDGTWTCSLTLATKYPAEIVWNANGSKTITVDASFATYETLSNTTVHSIASHEVSIGPLPVLIIKSQAE